MPIIKKPAFVPVVNRGKIGASYGVDELLGCLSPVHFDLACIQKNLQYIFTRGFNSIGMTCTLSLVAPLSNFDEGKKIGKKVIPTYYDGHCSSLFGGVQACDKFDSPARSASTCYTKCTESGKAYTSSGCDGDKIWCTCGGTIM